MLLYKLFQTNVSLYESIPNYSGLVDSIEKLGIGQEHIITYKSQSECHGDYLLS